MDAQIVGDAQAKLGGSSIERRRRRATGRRRPRSGPRHRESHGTARNSPDRRARQETQSPRGVAGRCGQRLRNAVADDVQRYRCGRGDIGGDGGTCHRQRRCVRERRRCARLRRTSGVPPTTRLARSSFHLPQRHTICRFLSGRLRTGLPVAAVIAFITAGATTQIVGSPTPPQKS